MKVTILNLNSRTILCRHKDFVHLNIEIDFVELWDGAPDKKPGVAGVNWSGEFRGRPLLAEQLMPSLRVVTSKERPKDIGGRLTALRSLFRYLDAYEKWAGMHGANTFPATVDTLEDFTTHHLQLWKTPSPGMEWQRVGHTNYGRVAQCLRAAVDRLNLPPLIVPSYPTQDTSNRDNPGEVVGQSLVSALAREAIVIFQQWERSDRLAGAGRNLNGVNRSPNANNNTTTINVEGGVCESDLHATYRAAVSSRNDLPLNRVEFLAVFGYGSDKEQTGTPVWWPCYQDGPNKGKKVRFVDLPSGLYPTSEQITVLFLLFLGRTGWNPGTADSLDIAEDINWFKKYTDKHTWLFAYKPRSKDWQETVAITQHRTGAYQIIKRLMERSNRLRLAIKSNSSLCTNHKIGMRSPWIYQRTNQNETEPVRVGVTTLQQAVVLRQVIAGHNGLQENSEKQIPINLVPGDLRDIFAAFAFANSGYSLFVTQMALGHKSSTVTFNYMRRRAWRAESEQKKNAMFVALIDQIETHRVIDLTMLRAQMDGVKVTQEMIDRLEAYRTYSGLGCSDPTHPPIFIDPTNPRDGTTPCAQGHLCPGCPKGRVFNDSLPHLARRHAELDWLSNTLPLEVFEESSLADQLLVLRATLKQWHLKDVEDLCAHWLAQIACGLHKPIRFSGEH